LALVSPFRNLHAQLHFRIGLLALVIRLCFHRVDVYERHHLPFRASHRAFGGYFLDQASPPAAMALHILIANGHAACILTASQHAVKLTRAVLGSNSSSEPAVAWVNMENGLSTSVQ
jgi:hypothetical protein